MCAAVHLSFRWCHTSVLSELWRVGLESQEFEASLRLMKTLPVRKKEKLGEKDVCALAAQG